MFIPRQVQKYTVGHPAPLQKSKSSTTTQPPQATTEQAATIPKKPKPEIDHTVAKEVILGLEQLLGSINPHTILLKEKHRDIEGHDDYIHLMSIVECEYFEGCRPVLSQALVRRALTAAGSELLQISSDGYHIRLKTPSTLVKLEDANTVYVEPHIAGVTVRPGQLARYFMQTLPQHFHPVRYIQSGGKSWALVTLSAPITDADTNNRDILPKDWIVLTKTEWRRRDNEYREYRAKCMKERYETHAAERKQHEAAQEEKAHDAMDLDPPSFNTPKEAYTNGLIVHVSNVHPAANKTTIRSLLDRTCQRYAQGAISRRPELKLPVTPEIQYIDYTKGLDGAYIRVKSPEGSKLLIDALSKRRRVMQSGDDVKGLKAEKEEAAKKWLMGKVLEGEVERRYWENINAHKAPKGGKAGGKKKAVESPEQSRSPGGKRHAKRQRVLSIGHERGK